MLARLWWGEKEKRRERDSVRSLFRFVASTDGEKENGKEGEKGRRKKRRERSRKLPRLF